MARRAPFEIGVLRELHRLAGFGHNLGLDVLDDLHRHIALREAAVGPEHLHRVLGGAERVHQRQRQTDVEPGAGRDHLADDDVDEPHLLGLVAAHRQQRLGAFQAHGRAQAAVELEERGLGEGIDRLVMVDGLVDVMEAGHAGQRLHAVLADPAAGLLGAPDVVQPLELGDRRVAHAVGLHLLGRMLEYVAHVPTLSFRLDAVAREPISHADRVSRGPISQQSSVTTGVWTCSYAHAR